MRRLILILMLIPVIGVGQIRLWQSKDFHNIDSTQRISWHDGKIVAIMTYNDHSFAKGVELTKKEFDESINQNKTISITDKTIKEYVDWCNADSNKIIIGYEFIFEEHNGGLTGWTSGVDVYDRKYVPKDKNYIKYYDVDFKKPDEVYYLWSKQQQQDIPQYYEHQSYIRAEPITKELEPTFIGFYEWLENKIKVNNK